MYGGGAGLSYSFAGSVDPTNPGLGNAARVVPVSSCGDATSTGRLSDTGTVGGVPGFGGRQYGGSSSGVVDPIDSLMKLAGQTGGGYTMNPVGGPAPFMERAYSGCGEGAFAVRNTLNEAAPSTITAPPALKGGRRRRTRKCWTGGRRCWSRRMRGGMAPVDAMVYAAPNSGYTFAPSNSAGGSAGTLSDGKVPFAVAVPYTAQPTASSACLKTGGRRRKSRKNRRSRRN